MNHTAEPPAGTGQVRDRWESLHALVATAEELVAADPAAGLAGLVAELDRRAQVQDAPVAEGVTLATLHAAKGLEWDVVRCAGMHEGAMPIVHADTPAAVEEERRLFYVGVTRARRELLISWAATRSPGGRGSRGPTRFLDRCCPPTTRLAGPRASRARARSPSAAAAARSWRSPSSRSGAATTARRATTRRSSSGCVSGERAGDRGAESPAYCVLTDATLTAIAEVKPADPDALARVPGIGPAKLEKYAELVLELIRSR